MTRLSSIDRLDLRLEIARIVAFALLLTVALSSRVPGQTGLGIVQLRVVPVEPVVIDTFDSLSQWSTNPANGVELSIHSDSGSHGRAMRIDFDFHGHPAYGIVHRAVNLDLPRNYEFTFSIRGEAPVNTLEFKLVDSTGTNVWWSRIPYFDFPHNWMTISQAKRFICFAWGPATTSVPVVWSTRVANCRIGLDIHHVSAIEFAITAGTGGKGSVWIDDLTVHPLASEAQSSAGAASSAGASSSNESSNARVYFQFQVEKPAGMPEAASAPVYPPELEKSGSSGIVFAQFVITSSGKAKMATFRILRTSGERFSQAVENWVHTVTFTPATIAGRPVDQLVQQSFSFSPPR